MYENMFESCLFDTCKVKDNKGAMICKAAENLVKECSENYATEFVDWRTDEMCSKYVRGFKVILHQFFPENSIWNMAVPLLRYSCMFQVEICSQQLEIGKSVCMFNVLAIVVETD